MTMGGHVFGGDPADECRELARVTRPGSTIIFCPGNQDLDNERHAYLVSQGYRWARFEEPGSGLVRKYWRQVVV